MEQILTILFTLSTGILISIITAFVFPPVQAFFTKLLFKLFWWLPSSVNIDLSGEWTSIWDVDSEKFPDNTCVSEAEIKQLLNKIYCTFYADGQKCYLIGEIDSHRYITGKWFDMRKGGYHGAFQFSIDPYTFEFAGKWVGYSSNGNIKEGDWTWTRKNQ